MTPQEPDEELLWEVVSLLAFTTAVGLIFWLYC